MSSYINDVNISTASYEKGNEALEYVVNVIGIDSDIIETNLAKAFRLINADPKYKKILVSISGGSDSDLVLDICCRADIYKKCTYVFFNTGLEYQATKEHLDYLEKKYQIKIRREWAKKPIPVSCKEFGEPFMNKRASEYIKRLQKVNFDWTNEDFDTLIKRYCFPPKTAEKRGKLFAYYEKYHKNPKGWYLYKGEFYRGVVSALRWWTNDNYKGSQCNIENNKGLKEFMIKYPPTFKISADCCKWAKKDVAHELALNEGYDLQIYGVRKAEGGTRSTAYKSCYSEHEKDGIDAYRPLWWYSNNDKKLYEKAYNIEHSRCYTEYGLCRTGCVGCPCARNTQKELNIVQEFEPKLYNAVYNVFKNSYDYEQKYRAFVKENF